MPGTNTYSPVAEPQEDKNGQLESIRRNFDEAIAKLGMLERAFTNTHLAEELGRLREKLVKDVNKKPSFAGEAEKIAKSAKALTKALTDPLLNMDQKLQAVKEFEQVACPQRSDTSIALSLLVRAVIFAAIILLGALSLALLGGSSALFFLSWFAHSPTIIAFVSMSSLLAASKSLTSTTAHRVVKEASSFASNIGFFANNVRGSSSQGSSNQRQETPTADVHGDRHPLNLTT
jgi:hypothetical protein